MPHECAVPPFPWLCRDRYVWKLVYIFMLGYEVDFGHMEIIALISSGKFSEKNVGYVAVSLLMKSEDEMMTLVVNSVRNDLVSHNNYFQVCAPIYLLALSRLFLLIHGTGSRMYLSMPAPRRVLIAGE